MNIIRRHRILSVALLCISVLLLASCAPKWELEATLDGEALESVNASLWRQIADDIPSELREDGAVPLERLLWESGVGVVESVTLDATGYAWQDIHDDAWVERDGRIVVGDSVYKTPTVDVISPPEMHSVGGAIIDLAPTVAGALGVSSPAKTTGRALGAYESDHAVMIFLDGFGYRQYVARRDTGITPFLDSLQGPRLAQTVYPSITRASTAAMITGTTPDINGVRARNQRSTDVQTIFDTVSEAGLVSAAVEGDALAFNMPGTEVILSGDRDGNGHTDDNTYANALEVINGGVPDLLWVHFHGIDDVGHTFGPDAEEVLAKMSEVDAYVRNLCLALPSNTLVLIFSDHGMHTVGEGERLGNHGTLLAEDMFVPIWVVTL